MEIIPSKSPVYLNRYQCQLWARSFQQTRRFYKAIPAFPYMRTTAKWLDLPVKTTRLFEKSCVSSSVGPAKHKTPHEWMNSTQRKCWTPWHSRRWALDKLLLASPCKLHVNGSSNHHSFRIGHATKGLTSLMELFGLKGN